MSNESTTSKPFKPYKVSKGKMLSYGMAPFIANMTVASYNLLLFYYYEVELGLSIALVGLSYVIYAIWNMLNDPLVGFLTDKPMRWSRKYGLRTPWIIVGGILMIISYYFLYAVPDVGDVKSNPWPLFWYMVFITCLFDTFFSIFQIHFIAGFGNTFRSKDDRRKGSMIMGLFAVCSAMFIRIVIIANVIVFGDPSSFVRAALLTGVISFIALILLLPGIHENETVKKRYFQIYEFLELQKMPYFKLLKLAFKQKGYVTFIIAITLVQCARILRIASELYMIKDVLNLDMTVIALLAFFFIICLVPSMIVSSYIVKKIGHANLWTIGLILLVFVYLSALWVTTLTHLIILYAFYGVASGAQSSVAYAMIADTNDEVVNAAGRHVEGTLGGVRTFFVRLAYIATGAIIAGVHLTTGYIPGASTQTPLALMGIRMHYGGVPALFVGIAAILMIKFYDIKGEKREQLMASLKAKRL
jgi:GPH family glycoside/pentoside/hexuronide:cation symporter